jgi:nucleoside phosphorylase
MTSGQQRAADVLLVAAHAPDLAGMRLQLGERLAGVIRNVRVCSKIVGVGMPVAAAAVARGILAVRPRVVVLIGTVGIYPGLHHYRPHDVVIPSHVQLLDHAVLAGKAAFLEPMPTVYETHPVISTALRACHSRAFVVPVASPLAQTTDDAVAASLHGATGCEGENTEAFAVAAACSAAEVPFVGVLGVTHVAGSTGRHDWFRFHRDAIANASNTIVAWLHHGAQGLPHE